METSIYMYGVTHLWHQPKTWQLKPGPGFFSVLTPSASPLWWPSTCAGAGILAKARFTGWFHFYGLPGYPIYGWFIDLGLWRVGAGSYASMWASSQDRKIIHVGWLRWWQSSRHETNSHRLYTWVCLKIWYLLLSSRPLPQNLTIPRSNPQNRKTVEVHKSKK